MTVLTMRRCTRCGKPARDRTITYGEQAVGDIIACDTCVQQTWDELDNVRPVFAALIACGAEREFANRFMTALLNHLYRKEAS